MDEYQLDKEAAQVNSIINGAVVANAATSLSEAEKAQARENIGASAVGSGLKIVAHYDTLEELEEAVPSPTAGEAYSVGETVPYRLYIWDASGGAWRDYGAIRAEDVTARIIQNTSVPVSTWTQDATAFTDYPYKAGISLSEVTGGDFPIVVFNPTDAIAGNFCPVAYAFNGTVEIFAKTIPSAAMTVPAMTFIALGSGAVSTKGITNASGGVPSGSIGTAALMNGAVTQVKLANGAVSSTYTTTIPTTGWTELHGYFSIEIMVNDLLATDTPVVDVDMSSVAAASVDDVQSAFSSVYRMTTAAKKLTVYALEKPLTGIPIRLLCVRR